jgi:hypothetical protein
MRTAIPSMCACSVMTSWCFATAWVGWARSTRNARIAVLRSPMAATRNAGCAASITAGSSTSKGPCSTWHRSRLRRVSIRGSRRAPGRWSSIPASSGSGLAIRPRLHRSTPLRGPVHPQTRSRSSRCTRRAIGRRCSKGRSTARIRRACIRRTCHRRAMSRGRPRPKRSGCAPRMTRRRGSRSKRRATAFAMPRSGGRSSIPKRRITSGRRCSSRPTPS